MCTISLKASGHKGEHNAANKTIKLPGCECVKIIYLNIYLFLSSVCSLSILSDCTSSCSCEFQQRSVFLNTDQQAAKWRILKYDIQEKWVHDKIHNRTFHFCQTGPDDTLEGAAWASLLNNNTKTLNHFILRATGEQKYTLSDHNMIVLCVKLTIYCSDSVKCFS